MIRSPWQEAYWNPTPIMDYKKTSSGIIGKL